MKKSSLSWLMIALGLTACGGEDGGTDPVDAGTRDGQVAPRDGSTDARTSSPDSATGGDGSVGPGDMDAEVAPDASTLPDSSTLSDAARADGSTAPDGAADASVACSATSLGTMVGRALATVDTTGRPSTFTSECISPGPSPEVVFSWTAPAAGSYRFTTVKSEFDTVLALYEACDPSLEELSCNDDGSWGAASQVVRTMTAGESVVIVIRGYDEEDFGTAVLSIVIATDEVCGTPGDEDHDELADCYDPDCEELPACIETACNDGLDNDNDGRADCSDTNCSEACDETDCDDGMDDDGDGATDCADQECFCNAVCSPPAAPTCPGTTLGSVVGPSVATGTFTTAQCESVVACAGSGGEYTYLWTAPSAGTYTFSTSSVSGVSTADTVLDIRSSCAADTTLECNDDIVSGLLQSRVTVELTAGQSVVVAVHAFDRGSIGAYTLSITGPM